MTTKLSRNHYAFVICDKEGIPNPNARLVFSSRAEAVNAFLAVKDQPHAEGNESYIRIYVLHTPIPTSFEAILHEVDNTIPSAGFERNGWQIFASTFPGDKVLNEYTEPMTDEEYALVESIKKSFKGMSPVRMALVMKTLTNDCFLNATFEA